MYVFDWAKTQLQLFHSFNLELHSDVGTANWGKKKNLY